MTTTLFERLLYEAALRIEVDRAAYERADPWSVHMTPDELDRNWGEHRDRLTRDARIRIGDWIRAVPPLYRTAHLTRLEPNQRPELIRGFLDADARSLFLAGPVGTGKSFAAWALAHEAVVRARTACVYSTPRLLLDMRPDGDASAFGRACRADLLVLDDLGAARPTDWAVEQMFSIADERVNHQRRTVVTTNSSEADLIAVWGKPTMDRLLDKSIDVELLGTSRRAAA